MDKYLSHDRRAHVWTHDWYAHVLFAQRLLEAARQLDRQAEVPRLAEAVRDFSHHWETLRGLRHVLQHLLTRSLDLSLLYVFSDRIGYRRPGCDPSWEFTIDELHDPAEGVNTDPRI
jgi:hypothetical protein